MIFLLANWKLCAMAALVASTTLFFGLWRHESNAFSAYQTSIKVAGEVAKVEAKRVNDLHQKTLEDVSNAWNSQLKPARDGAVAAYLNHQRVFPSTDQVRLSSAGDGSKGTDATGPERVAPDAGQVTCQPDAGLIQDSAQDALMIQKWQEWATLNALPVK